MFGWRGRIGLIVPSSNTTFEPEMRAMCPEGVEPYATRILFKPDERGLREMKKHVRRASLELSSEGLSDVIVFGCTVGSMIGGKGYDQAICAEIMAETGTPATTVTSAVLEAMNTLNVSRASVLTPYTKKINDLERAALEENGISVVDIKGFYEEVPDEEFTNRMIGKLGAEDVLRLAEELDLDGADCLFISCTNLAAIQLVKSLEARTGKPVLSSNLCSMWMALRKLKVSYQDGELQSKGHDGTLMRSLACSDGSDE
jgi:maleate isomerase